MKADNKKISHFRGRRFLRAMFFLALSPLFFNPVPVFAAIPQSINYQGFLLSKATNLPVETPQDITFVIYNAAAGGSALFTEGRCNVAVNKGRYDVEIGSMTGGIPGTVFQNNPNLWLEIQVDPDGDCAGTYEAMSPRIRLQASPYAFNSLYASTASAAAAVFAADTIAAHERTANGAITISTNLIVQGGLSAGLVESSAGGFKFPDGTIQQTAIANTMWGASGQNIYSMNSGNVGIGENLVSPLARLHVSTAAGSSGDLLLLSTGASAMFRVNGLGRVYGGSYYGDGSTLGGIVARAGDTMTGPLTLAGSSLTVTGARGLNAAKVRFLDNVEISSTGAANYGGVYVSTHVRLAAGAVFYGDGSGLANVTAMDATKVTKAGDTMTGQLTLAASTLTVGGGAFSVGGSTLSVLGGNTALGGASYLARLTVGGGIVATSSITAQGGLYSNAGITANAATLQTVTASSGTFLGWGPSNYSIDTASSIKVNAGAVIAPSFIGNGSQLTNVAGTDSARLLKAGDTMAGHLLVSPSSVAIYSYGAHAYALTVASAAAAGSYSFAVTTAGLVGVQVPNPSAPLEVNNAIMISNWGGADSLAHIYANGGRGYLRWSDNSLAGSGNASQGALGFLPGTARPFVFQALGTGPGTGGSEVFRINLDAADISAGNSWRFGIGTSNPLEKFHVAASMLVSTDTLAPILYISTATGLIGVGSASPDHKLHVNGGIVAASSITAQGGFFGDGSGLSNISAGGLPAIIDVSSIAARLGSAYGALVFTSNTYVNAKLAVGQVFTPASDLHVKGTARLDQKNPGDAVFLSVYPGGGGSAYISWDDGSLPDKKGALGMLSAESDLVYWAGSSAIGGGAEAFRIKSDGKFLIGGAGAAFAPSARLHIASDMTVSTSAAAPILVISTATGSVGISTGTAKERMHVASSFLVGADRASAVLYVSTGSSFTGIGTGNPRTLLEVGNGSILGDGTNTGSKTPPVTGGGSRFMWIPSASAIRAGYAATTEWDTVGLYSAAFGNRNTATADESVVAGGFNNLASGRYSVIGGGHNNTVQGQDSGINSGENSYLTGRDSVIPGGAYNVVLSSYAFAGGYNGFLNTAAQGSFLWGYDDVNGAGYTFNNFKISAPYVFLIDPADVKHYKVGVRTPSPQVALDVNGDAQFGSGINKSTFTAGGFWVPRAMTTAELQAAGGTPPVTGAVVMNSTIADLCISTGVAVGQWALAGSRGAGNCY